MVLEKTLESPLDCKEIQPVPPKGNQSWVFIGMTDAEAETPTGKDSDAGKDWRQEEKGTTGWDGWMASLTRWTWVWVSSASWWWTRKPGVLQSMVSQRVRHTWVTELNWSIDLNLNFKTYYTSRRNLPHKLMNTYSPNFHLFHHVIKYTIFRKVIFEVQETEWECFQVYLL